MTEQEARQAAFNYVKELFKEAFFTIEVIHYSGDCEFKVIPLGQLKTKVFSYSELEDEVPDEQT